MVCAPDRRCDRYDGHHDVCHDIRIALPLAVPAQYLAAADCLDRSGLLLVFSPHPLQQSLGAGSHVVVVIWLSLRRRRGRFRTRAWRRDGNTHINDRCVGVDGDADNSSADSSALSFKCQGACTMTMSYELAEYL